jgi:hypothetical protein
MNMITPMTRAGLVPPPGKLIIDVATHKLEKEIFNQIYNMDTQVLQNHLHHKYLQLFYKRLDH